MKVALLAVCVVLAVIGVEARSAAGGEATVVGAGRNVQGSTLVASKGGSNIAAASGTVTGGGAVVSRSESFSVSDDEKSGGQRKPRDVVLVE